MSVINQPRPSYRSALFALIRHQPLRYAWAQFLWISIWTMPILIGLVTARFFDELEAGIELNMLIAIIAATLLYAAGRSLFILLGMRNHGSMLFRGSALVRRNLLERIYEMPGAQALDDTPGEVVSRFRDDVENIILPFDLSVDILGSGTAAVISLIILFAIDPVITLTILIPVVAVGIVSERTGGMVRRYRIRARETTEAITGFLGETFAATQSVKVAGAEANMLARFRKLNDERRTMMVKDRTFTAVLEAVFRNTINIGPGLILLLAAGRLANTGAAGISIGQFSLLVFLLGMITEAAYFSGMFVARAKQGAVSFDRLIDSLHGAEWERLFTPVELWLDDELPPGQPPTMDPEPFVGLEVRGLSYRYNGTDTGISDVDLTVGAGEFVVVTGRIGSGKTTLLRTILGLLPATDGSIVWNGQIIEDPSTVMVPPRVAYTPQVPRLFSMSLRDNLALGDNVTDETIDESVYIATMNRDIDLMPEGLDTMIGPRGVRLSGGQIQRSASARMFARRPQLLVLDDVSSALDVETERLLWQRLFDSRSDVATLVVSHRQTAMARADRIMVMENGRVAATGTATELQRSSETFRAIWEGTIKG